MPVLSKKYFPIISQINEGIATFNQYVNTDVQFKAVDVNDANSYFEDFDKPWGEQFWPSKGSHGVYVLCGQHESKPDVLGAYIGKASHIVMGHRMYSHLHPHRNSEHYIRKSHDGAFQFEVMLGIPVTDSDARCLASALEELLIQRGIERIRLLNHVGKMQADSV